MQAGVTYPIPFAGAISTSWTRVLITFRREPGTMRRIIIVLVVLLIAAICWAVFERKKSERSQSRFVDYEYDLPRNMIIGRWKTSGRLAQIAFDLNEDLEDDSVVIYGSNENVSTVLVDEDHNGLFEVTYVYSPAEVLLTRLEDIGQDGFTEEYTRFTADSVFVYRDANEDSNFPDSELVSSRRR